MRRSFGPVVLAGLASAALLAVAGAHTWVSYTVEPQASLLSADVGQVPLAGALSFVLLACWGVLLVTRRVVRRIFSGLAALASLGIAVTVVRSLFTLPGDVRSSFPGTGFRVDTSFTGWFWVALVGALASTAATGLAVRLVGTWPEMGRRYDSPTGAPETAVTATSTDPEDPDAGNLELWKAIDQGHDPTA